MNDVVYQVECNSDYLTIWDDGYRIVRVSDDCPLVSPSKENQR